MHGFVVAGGIAFLCLALVGCGGTADGEEQIEDIQQELNNGKAFGGSFLIDDCGGNNVANPFTGQLNCPAGYTQYKINRQRDPESGCGGWQYFCGQTQSGFWFSSFEGIYQLHDPGTSTAGDVGNSRAGGALGCPSGATAYPMSRVYAPESHAGATQYLCSGGINGVAFSGAYEVNDCGQHNRNNPLTGATNCPAGTAPHKYGRAKDPESPGCGFNQYYCY